MCRVPGSSYTSYFNLGVGEVILFMKSKIYIWGWTGGNLNIVKIR